jgi:hypothetical protein
MNFINPQSPTFLGGQNVQNLFIIGLLAYAAWKLK